MACDVNNKEISSQCAELLVRPTYNTIQCSKNKQQTSNTAFLILFYIYTVKFA